MTKIDALELALTHVRSYPDRMYLQFLISVERRKRLPSLVQGITLVPEKYESVRENGKDSSGNIQE